MSKESLSNPVIAVIGLGYVGCPLAIKFSYHFKVFGFDIDNKRILDLKKGYDRTKELPPEELSQANKVYFTSNPKSIKSANVYIVTVPTPVDKNNNPNLKPLVSATKLAGQSIKKGDFIIYESTVFPGCTEQECVPILSKYSGLKYNEDYFVGYSPERINPGDKKNTLTNITKITSGSNELASNFIDELYKKIVNKTYKASSIAVAEAAKVIENTQRDVNIALINELALMFKKMNIDTNEVLKASSTKWNFLPFQPGLVGGHCIGVDPYYLTHKAAEVGHHPEIILAGRRINDSMGHYIAENVLYELSKNNVPAAGAKIAVLGLTFKENCPDLRNTKVKDIFDKLNNHNCNIIISDEYAEEQEIYPLYKSKPKSLEDIIGQDALIIAVKHDGYYKFREKDWLRMLKPGGIVFDIKSIYNQKTLESFNFSHWKL